MLKVEDDVVVDVDDAVTKPTTPTKAASTAPTNISTTSTTTIIPKLMTIVTGSVWTRDVWMNVVEHAGDFLLRE